MRTWGLAALLGLFAACKPVGRAPRPGATPRILLAGVGRRDAGAAPRSLDAPPTPAAPTMYRLDRGHTGRSGWRLPRRPRVSARVATRARISAQPVVAGDGLLVFGSHDGVLYEATRAGAVRWRFNTGDRIYTTPAVTDAGALLLGTDADRFLKVTPRGRLELALATEADADTSAVVAADGTVRVAAGRTLWSLDADLTVRWRLDVGGKIFSSPALAEDGTAVFGSQDNHVYAVGPDGAVRWRFQTGDDVDASPMLDAAGNVYAGSDDGSVYSLTPAGAERWRRPMGGFVRAAPALGLDGTVIVATYGPRARLAALNREDGRELWSYAIPGPPTREYGIASAPLVDADGRVAFGSPDDAIHFVDRDGSHPLRFPMPADVDSAPVLIDDRVMAVGCDDGHLYVIADAQR